MKAEGGRMKAEGKKQKAENRRLAAFCFLSLSAFILPPSAFYLFPVSLALSATGRALLVAALVVSTYALVRYWRSLKERPRKIRYALISLRAIVLLLVSCAIAGVRFEYQTKAGARVLLRSLESARAGPEGETDMARGQEEEEEKARTQVLAALRAKAFEVVEEEPAVEAERDGGPFVAGLVVTVGAMSGAEAQREIERANARAGGAPVYVLTADASSDTASVILESTIVSGRAVRGVPLAVRCTIHARGMSGRESLLTISDEAKAQVSARVAWTLDDERRAVTLTIVPKVAGWVDYTAKVEAAGDERSALLSRAFAVYAEERRTRVLFFESEPTWEAKFIRRALEQSELFEIDYFAQVSRVAAVGMSENAGGRSDDDASAGAGAKGGGAPEAKLHAALRSAAELNRYDAVIIGASLNSLLSAAEAARLREWVERRGGGLVITGGNSFNGSIVAPGGNLSSLVPAEIAAQSFASPTQEIAQGRPLEAEKTSGGVSLVPTEAGANGALSGYLNAGSESAGKAGALTGQGLRLGALRPGATRLAVAGRTGATGPSEDGATLVAAMRYGEGRALVFAPADSWRMRTGGDEESAGEEFKALWQGIVLWASAGARPASEIVLSDDSPAEEDEVVAEIRARDAMFTPLKIEKVSARLQPLTEETGEASATAAEPRELSFVPDGRDSSVWRARVPLQARGRFAIEADYVADGRTESVEKYFAVTAARPAERGAALDALRRAARETGGELIAAADTDLLVERLSAISSSAGNVRRVWELRSWWPLAFLIPLLLSVEWFLRRWWRED